MRNLSVKQKLGKRCQCGISNIQKATYSIHATYVSFRSQSTSRLDLIDSAQNFFWALSGLTVGNRTLTLLSLHGSTTGKGWLCVRTRQDQASPLPQAQLTRCVLAWMRNERLVLSRTGSHLVTQDENLFESGGRVHRVELRNGEKENYLSIFPNWVLQIKSWLSDPAL